MAGTYITLADVVDELLLMPLQKHVDYANQYVEDYAKRLGVAAAQIATPPPLLVKDLAVAVACAKAGQGKWGVNPVIGAGADGQDLYQKKRAAYLADQVAIEKLITAAYLRGS